MRGKIQGCPYVAGKLVPVPVSRYISNLSEQTSYSRRDYSNTAKYSHEDPNIHGGLTYS